MAATKTHLFTQEEKEIGMLGRALAHPARIRILYLLEENQIIRNCDLVIALQLTKKAVHDHLLKLKDASLIKMDFHSNSYFISKIEGSEYKMVSFLKNRA
jgi:DNA-binding transcriptional ArsR family regulator